MKFLRQHGVISRPISCTSLSNILWLALEFIRYIDGFHDKFQSVVLTRAQPVQVTTAAESRASSEMGRIRGGDIKNMRYSILGMASWACVSGGDG